MTAKKKITIKSIKRCKKNMHCFHSDNEGQWNNSMMYPAQIIEYHCCKCGMNEIEQHGPFHPRKKAITTNVVSGTTMIWSNNGGNIATSVPPMNGTTTATLDPHAVRNTIEKLMTGASHYECSSDCGCKQPVIIKKPTKTA